MKTIAHSICVLFLPLRTTTTATLLSFCVFVVVCVYLTLCRTRDA